MDYPWYETVEGRNLQQGDILMGFPVVLPEKLVLSDNGSNEEINVKIQSTDVIILTQSCDLSNSKVDIVILCPIFKLTDIESHFGNNPKSINKRKEDIRQGKEPGFHMINSDSNLDLEVSLVEFKRIYTAPKITIEEFTSSKGERQRLLPPYREHLAQAFARYFMRVGLPEDIPSFT